MKIRNGFVSNSSSSSFVIILTKDQYTELLKTIDDYQKKVLDALGHEEAKVCGQDAIIFQGMQGNYSSFEDLFMDDYDDDAEMLTDEDDDDDADEDDDDDADEDFEKKYGYSKDPEEAFNAINWPEGTWSGGADC